VRAMHHFNCSAEPTFRFHIEGYNEHKVPLLCHDEGGALFWGKPFSHNNKSQNVQHKCPVYRSQTNPKGLITRKICKLGDPNEKPSSKCAKKHRGPCITHAPNAEMLLRRARELHSSREQEQRPSSKRKSEERYTQRKRRKKSPPKTPKPKPVKVEMHLDDIFFPLESDEDVLNSSESDDFVVPKKRIIPSIPSTPTLVTEDGISITEEEKEEESSQSSEEGKEVCTEEGEVTFVVELLRRAEKNLSRHNLFYVSLYQYRQCLNLAKTDGIMDQAKKGERESLSHLRKSGIMSTVI